MRRLGLTGGIGCGKSTVGQMLSSWGIPVCDTDRMAHELYERGGAAYEKVLSAFGRDVLDSDDRVDRHRLAQMVFCDPKALKVLNEILHPMVAERLRAWLDRCEDKGKGIAVGMVPLLFEAGLDQGWDCIACVACDSEVQARRLKDRGWVDAMIKGRINGQWPLEAKIEKSDVVIWNNGSFEELECSVKRVLEKLERK